MVSLHDAPSLTKKTFGELQMLIIGFGTTEFEGKVSPVLREVQSNVVPAEACKEAYRKAKINVDAATLLCTGVAGGGKGSCQGTYALATLRSVISSLNANTSLQETPAGRSSH
jgi:hypothetical protein